MDTAQYLASSLEKLVDGCDRQNGFYHTRRHFPGDKVDLVMRKGVYPYEHMDSWERFDDNRLPSRDAFYNTLNETEASEEDYTHAWKVWEAFGMRSMGDYHDLYLKTDVLLLADVVENFRRECMEHYGLDPLHYFSLPSYSWDCFLKTTGVELELLQDVDMYTFLESGIRGGVSMISHRRATANNPGAHSDETPYDSSKPNSYIMYLDANNLYGWYMSQQLPHRDFKWLDLDGADKGFDPTVVDADGDTGYVLEVDLEYPRGLHDAHNTYPLAPEKMVIDDEMLSPFARGLKVKFGGVVGKMV